MKILTMLMMLFFVACSSSGEPRDAGDGDGDYDHDYDHDYDGGDDGGGGADVDLGDDFGLSIPAGTQACSQAVASGSAWDIDGEYLTKGRVTFSAGLFRLPRDQASFELDWIEKVELGPDKTEPTPVGAGVFTRTIEGTADDGIYWYEWAQAYDLGGQSYTLVFKTGFTVTGGVAAEQVKTFDDAFISTADMYSPMDFMLTAEYQDRRTHAFTTCLHTLYRDVPYDVTVENGDTMHMDQKFRWGDLCKICPAEIVGAEFDRGQDKRVVTDFFRLAHVAGQHNWNQKFIVMFDQPVGTAHGLLMDETSMTAGTYQMQYLDAELNVIDTAAITSYIVGW
jgi:hypothetical protein